MAKSFPEVDVVIVGMGWCGGILAKELSESGMKVVGLERGATRTVENDFSVPHIRDELEYHARTGLAQNLKKETWTVRNQISETALPMRKYGSFIPGDGLGGSGVHWNGQTWRWTDMEFKIKSNYVERYGKKFIPEDMTIQDWGITYAELEPYYDHFEKIAAVSGVAGNLNGQIKNEGNPFEAPRKNQYPLPPLKQSLACDLFTKAAKDLGYHPFPIATANASAAYKNPDGIQFGQCQYCGFCEKFGCESNAKGSPLNTVIPIAMRQPTFELRTNSWVTKVVMSKDKKQATGVNYLNTVTGEECFQAAKIVILAAFGLNNTQLMLTSGIGSVYDPVSQKGLIGKNYAYQTGANANLFFKDKIFNPFMSAGGLITVMDDFHANWDFDRSPQNFIGGATIWGGFFNGRPLEYHPTPPGTPSWGSAWKESMATWYQKTMRIAANGSVMPNRYNYLDLDSTYKNAAGTPLMRMTFDYKPNEHRLSTFAAGLIDQIGKSLNPTMMTKPAPRVTPWNAAVYQSTHNTGGTIMGTNPANSVVNKHCQSWDLHNLFILGSSVFPHNSAYNPTGLLGALSYRTADIIKTIYQKNPGKLIT